MRLQFCFLSFIFLDTTKIFKEFRIMDLSLKEIFCDFRKYLDQEIIVQGWVKTSRNSKNITFVELSDGSCFKTLQIVCAPQTENYSLISKINIGSSIWIRGKLRESIGIKQIFEIEALEVKILNQAEPDFPLQKKRHTLEFLRTIAHLRPRTNTFQSVFRIRSLAAFAIHEFFNKNDFIYVNTPIITASDCEGAGEMFRVTTLDLKNNNKDASEDFFGKMAYLTVSGQLSAETFASAFKNVYTFGPTFRAENSNTPRHAAEFWMIEPEMAFCDLKKCMNVAENMLKYAINYVLKNAKDEINFCNTYMDKNLSERLNKILESDFDFIDYGEAIKLLEKADKKFDYEVKWGVDLQTEHERYLTEEIFKKPVFVINYPKDIKAFYMRLNDDEKTVAAMDLLVPGIGEIIGGSQREERYEYLLSRMTELNLDEKNYWWYLDLRKYGSVVHSGYGLGFERFIMYLTGISNIRDVIPFPRTVNSAEF